MKTKWVFTRLFVVFGFLTIVMFATLSAQKEASKDTKPAFQADSRPGCHKNSWTPEVFSFYGDPAAVTAKLDKFDMNLPDRRIFMFMIESTQEARLSLFELPKSGKPLDTFHLWTWKGNSARALREKATESILANKGYDCVGELIKGLVMDLKPDDKGDIAAPKTALAAFGPTIQEYGNAYIRVTVFLLC